MCSLLTSRIKLCCKKSIASSELGLDMILLFTHFANSDHMELKFFSSVLLNTFQCSKLNLRPNSGHIIGSMIAV